MSAPLGTQLRLTFGLWWKSIRRRAMRAGDGPKAKGGFGGVALFALAFVYVIPLALTLGKKIANARDGHTSPLRYVVWAVVLSAFANALVAYAPRIGRVVSLWRSSFLDLLPIDPWARAIVVMTQGLMIALFAGPVLYVVAGKHRLFVIVIFVLAASFGSSLFGQAVVTVMRSATPRLYQRISVLGVALMILPFMLLVNATTLATLVPFPRDPMLHVTRWIEGTAPSGRYWLGLLAYVAVAMGAYAWSETLPRDTTDSPVRSSYHTKSASTPARVELRMLWRQGALKATILQLVVLIAFTVFVFVLPAKLSDGMSLAIMLRAVYGQGVLLLATSLFAVASAVTSRDLNARPFLAALPTTPAQILRRVTSAFRTISLPWIAIYLVLGIGFVATHRDLPTRTLVDTTARTAMVLVGIWLLCSCVPAVSFLTRGLGSTSLGASQMPSPIVTILVVMPLFGIVGSPTLVQALVALVTFAALTREAQRAAQRCLSWIDDSGEGERDTPVWRALLVLGGFFAAQSLVASGLQLTHLSPELDGAIAAAGAAILLAVLSILSGPRYATRSSSLSWDALGLVGGIASGVAGLGFMWLLRKTGVVEAGTSEVAKGFGTYALAFTVIAIVPICEERFFRGWLQTAIANDLGARAAWAPVYAALAFSGAHLGTFFVPQLVLGLVAGGLFAKSGRIRPGVIAHIAHNAIVILLAR